MKGFGTALALVSGLCLGLSGFGAQAQRLSDRPITIVVPATAGTGLDVLARVLAEGIKNRWKQPVVVENKAGASSNIGTAFVARAEADGHTLLLIVNTFAMNAALFKTLPYDPKASFSPVVKVATGGMALAVDKAFPATSVKALIEDAKARPGVIDYSSPGRGTPQHLAMELFKLRAGVDLKHIPYTGSAGAVRDLMAGHIRAMFIPVHTVLSLAKDGHVRILAIGSDKRSVLVPDVPTLQDEGVAGFDVDLWYGILAPAGTPVDIVRRLNTVVNEVLADPKTRELLEVQGLTIDGGQPEILSDLIGRDLARWQTIIREAGIVLE